jgi:hypothetical protein
MKDIFILPVHLLTAVAKLLGPGGAKAIIAENLLLKQQLMVVARSRRRAPSLSTADRFLMGFWSLFLRPGRIAKVASEYSAINIVEVSPMPGAEQVS